MNEMPMNAVFALLSAQRVSGPEGWASDKRITEAYALIVVAEGSGHAGADGRKLALAKGKAFLLKPGTVFEAAASSEPETRLTYYEIAFRAVPIGEPFGADPLSGVGFSREEEIRAVPFSKLLSLAEEICAREKADAPQRHPIGWLKKNGRLQELIAFLLECLESANADPGSREFGDSRRAVARSIAYLREAYREEIGVNQLADLAGVGRSQYARLFREMTGRSPIAYMTELRIERAKELLATTGDKLRDIARLTGFRDEYYFNRRFKQTVGLSPKQYMHARKKQLKVLSMEYLGEMLALGVRPVAAARYLTECIAQGGPLSDMADIGNVEDELDTIIGLKPDLILLRDGVVASTQDRLSRIAPVAKVSWNDDVFAHVNAVAGILGREREGKAWSRRYESKAERARAFARSRIPSGETVALFGLFPDFMCVFSDRNVGHTFYNVLGFEPPSSVKKMIAERVDIGGRNIALSELNLFDADRVYVLAHGGPEAEARLSRLMESPEWQALTAVRNGKVGRLNGRWFSYDAYTLEWAIDEAVNMLAGG